MSEKTKAEMLREELFYKKQSLFEIKTEEELSAAKDYSRGYCEYLDNSKTEREAVKTTVSYLQIRALCLTSLAIRSRSAENTTSITAIKAYLHSE